MKKAFSFIQPQDTARHNGFKLNCRSNSEAACASQINMAEVSFKIHEMVHQNPA